MQNAYQAETIQFAYRGRVYTISALIGGDGQRWVYGCHELGLVRGSFTTPHEALLAGIATLIQEESSDGLLAA
jgi:hypothetical protein